MSAGIARVCCNCNTELVDGERACATCGGERIDRACDACGVILKVADVTCPSCTPPLEATMEALAEPLREAPTGTPTQATSDAQAATTHEQPIEEALQLSLADEYDLTRVISRSERATVYQAEDLARHRQVAIKVLAPGRVAGDAAAAEFLREAKHIAALKHPHIRGLYAVRQLDDEFMLVMPLVEGRPLSAMLAEHGPLALEVVRAVANEIGGALAYAHDHHVTHGAVRSEHILLAEDGRVLLTDFAYSADLALVAPNGAAAYLSPEQCDQLDVTSATDQYALGVVLYEMLTGHVPFAASSAEEMLSFMHREPSPIRLVRDECPAALESAIMRMLAKQPARRWPSMADAIAAVNDTTASHDDDSMFTVEIVERAPAVTMSASPSAVVTAATYDLPFPSPPATEPATAPSRAAAPAVPQHTTPPPARKPRAGGRLALTGAAIAVGAFALWRTDYLWNTAPAGANASFKPATFYAGAALRAVGETGYTVAPAPLVEDFSASANDRKLLVVDGRVSLAAGVHGYGLGRWRASTGNMAVHVDVWIEPGDERHLGGLILRAAKNANYFLHLTGTTNAGLAVTMRSATGDSILVPLTSEPSIRAGKNRVDVVVVNDRLSAFVNGVRVVDALNLPITLDGQVGLFGGVSTGVEFDNLAIAQLTRK